MPIKTASELDTLTLGILLAAGASESNARRVAEALVSSHLAGHDSHGVQHLPRYVNNIDTGQLKPRAKPDIVKETASSALVRGNWTFGHVSAEFAMRLALEKAAVENVSIVTLVEVNHIGRLGEYGEMAAADNQVGIVVAGGAGVIQPAAVPYGGSRPVLHTNPIAMGFPAGNSPMIVDFATTATSGSKVLLAAAKGEPVPPDCIVDRDGNPTTDPTAIIKGGSHLPFGGHKGFGIMLAVEFLGRILAGADTYAIAGRSEAVSLHRGVTMIAINPSGFQPLDEYLVSASEMMDRVRDVAPAAGVDRVLAPGDPEQLARQDRLANGISIPDATWVRLMDLAGSLGLDDSF